MKRIDFVKKERCIRISTTEVLECCNISHAEQINIINNLFMGCDSSNCTTLNRELEKKRYNYYQQDLRKKRVIDITDILTRDELIEKLVSSKLKCLYCARKLLVFYKYVKEPCQWTLDRVDNTQAHTCDNTCIACLECNLKRRDISHTGYAFTKSLNICKLK